MINIGIGIPFGQRSAGIDPQAKIAFDSLQSAGFTTPQGITGINAAFKTIKTIYGTSDITTAISFFGDPSLAYQIGAGSGTTLGQAIRTLPNIIDPTRATDAVQTTAASQPLLLTHTTGQNYWFGSGIDGNFVSTPNRTPAGSTQLDIRVKFEGGNLNANRTFFSQSGAGGGETDIFILRFANASTGTINMLFGAGLALSQTSSVGIGAIANYMGWIRVTYSSNGTNADVTFFSSTDGSSWTQLSTHTVVSARLGNQNSPYQIGSNIGFNPFQGKISRATASNLIGGAPVVDFNPNQYNAANSQTQWTSSTGEVWTINTGTTATGYKGVLVDRAIVQGDGIDDRMQATNYALTATGASVYSTYRKFASTSSGGFGVVVETGANTNTNQGILVDFNEGTNTSFNRIRGNVGTTGASFLDTSILLKLITSVFDLSLATDEASFYAINNSVLTQTGVANVNNTTMTTSGLNLMARSTAAGFANMTFNGIIISSNANGSTQRTAMYNYIRSINNAAF